MNEEEACQAQREAEEVASSPEGCRQSGDSSQTRLADKARV